MFYMFVKPGLLGSVGPSSLPAGCLGHALQIDGPRAAAVPVHGKPPGGLADLSTVATVNCHDGDPE